jgi:DNA-binding transcriptional ArsR family regulator
MNLRELAELAAALGNEKRLKILKRLAAGPATTGDLCAVLGGVPISTMRDHVNKLIAAGFVLAYGGGEKIYSLNATRLSDFRITLQVKIM